jgi:hypothetical protein
MRRSAAGVVLALSLAIPLGGAALGATASAAAAPAAADAATGGDAVASGVAYMGSTRDLSVCHSTGLWYVLNGHATYYYCQEYYDAATGRWYALYVGV